MSCLTTHVVVRDDTRRCYGTSMLDIQEFSRPNFQRLGRGHKGPLSRGRPRTPGGRRVRDSRGGPPLP